MFGYAAQAGLYFSALTRIDASLVALILYVYPVLVMAAAIAIGRERASRRRVWALGVALAGIALVLSGAATGRFDWLGALMALGAALTYTGYILVGDRLTADISPLALAALVCTGATGTFVLAGAVRGGPDLGFAPAGWVWLAALALVSTVGAILLFFAGMARVGPSVAAILSILEPVVTVVGRPRSSASSSPPPSCSAGAGAGRGPGRAVAGAGGQAGPAPRRGRRRCWSDLGLEDADGQVGVEHGFAGLGAQAGSASAAAFALSAACSSSMTASRAAPYRPARSPCPPCCGTPARRPPARRTRRPRPCRRSARRRTWP